LPPHKQKAGRVHCGLDLKAEMNQTSIAAVMVCGDNLDTTALSSKKEGERTPLLLLKGGEGGKQRYSAVAIGFDRDSADSFTCNQNI